MLEQAWLPLFNNYRSTVIMQELGRIAVYRCAFACPQQKGKWVFAVDRENTQLARDFWTFPAIMIHKGLDFQEEMRSGCCV